MSVPPAITVVIADDHPLFREGMRSLLEKDGRFLVLAAAEAGDTAAEAIRNHAPVIALLDHSMPRGSGLDVIREVRARGSATRCALLSSFGQPLLVAEALRAGADGYLTKEDPVKELAAAAVRLAAGECVISASVDRAALRDAMNTLAITGREYDVLRSLVRGASATDIGAELGISPRTVETYRNQLVAKFGARNAVDLVRRAVESGVILDR